MFLFITDYDAIRRDQFYQSEETLTTSISERMASRDLPAEIDFTAVENDNDLLLDGCEITVTQSCSRLDDLYMAKQRSNPSDTFNFSLEKQPEPKRRLVRQATEPTFRSYASIKLNNIDSTTQHKSARYRIAKAFSFDNANYRTQPSRYAIPKGIYDSTGKKGMQEFEGAVDIDRRCTVNYVKADYKVLFGFLLDIPQCLPNETATELGCVNWFTLSVSNVDEEISEYVSSITCYSIFSCEKKMHFNGIAEESQLNVIPEECLLNETTSELSCVKWSTLSVSEVDGVKFDCVPSIAGYSIFFCEEEEYFGIAEQHTNMFHEECSVEKKDLFTSRNISIREYNSEIPGYSGLRCERSHNTNTTTCIPNISEEVAQSASRIYSYDADIPEPCDNSEALAIADELQQAASLNKTRVDNTMECLTPTIECHTAIEYESPLSNRSGLHSPENIATTYKEQDDSVTLEDNGGDPDVPSPDLHLNHWSETPSPVHEGCEETVHDSALIADYDFDNESDDLCYISMSKPTSPTNLENSHDCQRGESDTPETVDLQTENSLYMDIFTGCSVEQQQQLEPYSDDINEISNLLGTLYEIINSKNSTRAEKLPSTSDIGTVSRHFAETYVENAKETVDWKDGEYIEGGGNSDSGILQECVDNKIIENVQTIEPNDGKTASPSLTEFAGLLEIKTQQGDNLSQAEPEQLADIIHGSALAKEETVSNTFLPAESNSVAFSESPNDCSELSARLPNQVTSDSGVSHHGLLSKLVITEGKRDFTQKDLSPIFEENESDLYSTEDKPIASNVELENKEKMSFDSDCFDYHLEDLSPIMELDETEYYDEHDEPHKSNVTQQAAMSSACSFDSLSSFEAHEKRILHGEYTDSDCNSNVSSVVFDEEDCFSRASCLERPLRFKVSHKPPSLSDASRSSSIESDYHSCSEANFGCNSDVLLVANSDLEQRPISVVSVHGMGEEIGIDPLITNSLLDHDKNISFSAKAMLKEVKELNNKGTESGNDYSGDCLNTKQLDADYCNDTGIYTDVARNLTNEENSVGSSTATAAYLETEQHLSGSVSLTGDDDFMSVITESEIDFMSCYSETFSDSDVGYATPTGQRSDSEADYESDRTVTPENDIEVTTISKIQPVANSVPSTETSSLKGFQTPPTFHVVIPPKFIGKRTNRLNCQLGKTARLKCSVISYPEAKVAWYKDGRLLEIYDRISHHVVSSPLKDCEIITEDGCSEPWRPPWFPANLSQSPLERNDLDVHYVLKIDNLKQLDEGLYICKAWNAAGVATYIIRICIEERPTE